MHCHTRLFCLYHEQLDISVLLLDSRWFIRQVRMCFCLLAEFHVEEICKFWTSRFARFLFLCDITNSQMAHHRIFCYFEEVLCTNNWQVLYFERFSFYNVWCISGSCLVKKKIHADNKLDVRETEKLDLLSNVIISKRSHLLNFWIIN